MPKEQRSWILEVAQRSFDAWNRHDADAILALYAEGGTYSAPRAGGALIGQAIANYARAVFTAYPDMSLEIISIGDTGGGLVASQWVLHGTHTGPYFDGSPPTGRSLTLPGASFTQVEGDKIRSERTYTDRQAVTEQLGFTPKKTWDSKDGFDLGFDPTTAWTSVSRTVVLRLRE